VNALVYVLMVVYFFLIVSFFLRFLLGCHLEAKVEKRIKERSLLTKAGGIVAWQHSLFLLCFYGLLRFFSVRKNLIGINLTRVYIYMKFNWKPFHLFKPKVLFNEQNRLILWKGQYCWLALGLLLSKIIVKYNKV
jgi:hypothetical protein